MTYTPREQLLAEAEQAVMGDRNEAYNKGSTTPLSNMQTQADLMQAYLNGRGTRGVLGPTDSVAFGLCIKLARLASNPNHHDSWVDVAGYAAVGYEVSLTQPKGE